MTTLPDKVERLVRLQMRPSEMARVLNSTPGSVRTALSKLRRQGRIGMWEGREDPARLTNAPYPFLMLMLTPEQRMLVDIEAEDRGMTPADLVIHILSTVMADQALVEAVLGEE